MAGYDDHESIAALAPLIRLTPAQADLLARSVFDRPADFRVREHQQDSLLTSVVGTDVRNVVVTAGTGSGKTESFLLPVFARLLREASGWPPSAIPGEHWWADEYEDRVWEPVRRNEKRQAAVRAIVLYPTNALVQDQVTRLRRAIATASDRAALSGNRLYVGQYTGSTMGSNIPPVGQSQADRRRRRQVSAELRAMVKDMDGLLQAIAQGQVKDSSVQWEFPDPWSSEMLTRWDMQVSSAGHPYYEYCDVECHVNARSRGHDI